MHSKWLLNLIRVLVRIAWYLNFVLIVFVLVILTVKFTTDNYSQFDTRVRYQKEKVPEMLTPLSDNARNISLHTNEIALKMEVKNTPVRIICAYVSFILAELLLMTILYYTRKIFATFKQSIPFKYENVKRLKIIALCIALFAPLSWIDAFATNMILANSIDGFRDTFWLSWNGDFKSLFIGAIIYIVADIFRYGFELQQENKEFV